MMVGKIVNENAGAARRVQRGEEKGYFAFGGSTVIVLAQKEAQCRKNGSGIIRGLESKRGYGREKRLERPEEQGKSKKWIVRK